MKLRAALRAATIALLATAASIALPARAHSQDITCEPGDLEVLGLEFRGNQAIGDDELALRVTTTPSAWGRRHLRAWFSPKRCLNRSELALDLLRIKAHYRNRGFYFAQVDTVVTPVGTQAVRVAFDITEGNPLRLASYRITGLEGLADSAEIMRNVRLKVGEPFDILVFGADMDTVIRRLRDAGYYRATTIPGYDWDTAGVARADAFITVVAGKRARFDTATIQVDPVSANTGQQIDNSIIRRALAIDRGDWYSDRAIVQAQRNLFQLGTYQHIDVAPLSDSLQPPGDTLIVLGVRLTEDYMRQVDSEFGWATLDCGRVRTQYSDKNFLGTARRFELTGQASKLGFGEPVATPLTRDLCTFDGRSPLASDSLFSSHMYYFAGLTLRQPQLLGTRVVPSLSVYSERRGEYKAYLRTTDFGADLAATTELADRMPLRLAYTFEFGRTEADPPALCVLFNRCDAQSQAKIEERARLGVASATLARIRTDNVISPTRGWMLRAEGRTSRLPLTEQTLYFNKGTGDIAWYRPIGGNVLALRLRGGIVASLSNLSDFIPPQERLYAGGPTSVRGFQQNELGSKVYIARDRDVRQDTVVLVPNDTVYRFSLRSDTVGFDTDSNPDRSVPLGGDALVVANIEYRIRDPFFFPNNLQYTLFLDGGDVWSRDPTQGQPRWSLGQIKWTPGVGLRARTLVGPIQVNVAWNRFTREPGPLYYNPDVSILACVTPGTLVDYRKDPITGQLVTTDNTCGNFAPPKRERWYQKLTFTFSIGPDF